mmetsp:Transcript_5701/g.8111  ORF Transcript_5701/g.8111 Transcript_5701/m.8111 type:complete len:765 (-) Transcript_5701:618-2912(-)
MGRWFDSEPSPLKLPVLELNKDNKWLHIRLNPYVTVLAAGVIWGFVAFTVAHEDSAYNEFTDWAAWIGDEWTWLYIGSQDIWILVLLYLAFSKYAKLKLGADDEEPEFSRLSWFAMLFAAGVGVGLFYYGVTEPIWHYTSPAGRWYDSLNDNDRAQHALMVTFFHWGFHGWIPYTTIGSLLAIMSYRRGYPMTIRSTFVPLLGDKVLSGVVGDSIDVMSICATLFGVCTSLGLGVQQLNTALVRIDRGTYAGIDKREEGRLDIQYSTRAQIIIIWFVTCMATLSVVSGLKAGIQLLSNITFGLGCFLILCVLFMGDTVVILNSITSAFGYYLWYLPKISWHTDAWEQADDSLAPDGEGGSSTWMGGWTIFYWGWWISWAPFVGTFIAKISRGRTLGEFIAGTLIIPTAYCILWFGVLGSEGIYRERQAEKLGLDCSNSFSEVRSTRLGEDGWQAEHNSAYDFRVSCLGLNDQLFDLLSAYGSRTMAYFSSTITAIILVLYFVTSSDSGSLVIDSIAANGDEEPPILQRIFWACTEGAAAHALLKTGKVRALRALQSVSIVTGLPYTFILCYQCVALLNVVQEEIGELDIHRAKFRNELLAPYDYVLDTEQHGSAAGGICSFVTYCFMPFVGVYKIANKISDLKNEPKSMLPGPAVGAFFFWVFAWVMLCMSPVAANLRMVAGVLYIFFAGIVGLMRYFARDAINCKRGSLFSDLLSAVLCYPFVLMHTDTELAYGPILTTVKAEEGEKMIEKEVDVVEEGKEEA